MDDDLYQSRVGYIKSLKEWQEESEQFFNSLPYTSYTTRGKQYGVTKPKDSWDRFKRIIGLQPLIGGEQL